MHPTENRTRVFKSPATRRPDTFGDTSPLRTYVPSRPDTFGDTSPSRTYVPSRPDTFGDTSPLRTYVPSRPDTFGDRSSGGNAEGLSASQLERGATPAFFGGGRPQPMVPSWAIWAGAAFAGLWAFRKFT